MHDKGDKRIKKASEEKEILKSRGMVPIPYVEGLSEAFSRILKTYRISTAVRPHTMLRNMLVHHKDRISDEENQKWFTGYRVKTVNVSTLEKQETTGSKSKRTS